MKKILPAMGLALALSACGEDVTELSRSTSPDGAWDAITVRVQATRGKDSPFIVMMGPKGVGNGKAARVFLADLTQQPQVTWAADGNQLTIRCDGARVWSYHNFFNAPNGDLAASIALECGQQGYKALTPWVTAAP